MSAQVIDCTECPICMDTIEGLCNRVVTECGHAFHCSCLMQNAAHNGFGCPYCRTKMAETPADEEDEDYESIEEETVFDEDALTSFRMFHQQIDGQDVEEEVEEWEDDDEQDDEEETDEMPDAAYMAEKLAARGVTFEDLVKNILFLEHSNFGEYYPDYERRSSEVYGRFRSVITQYTPTPPPIVTPVIARSNPTPSHIPNPNPTEALPVIAESKSVAIHRRREFLQHI